MMLGNMLSPFSCLGYHWFHRMAMSLIWVWVIHFLFITIFPIQIWLCCVIEKAHMDAARNMCCCSRIGGNGLLAIGIMSGLAYLRIAMRPAMNLELRYSSYSS